MVIAWLATLVVALPDSPRTVVLLPEPGALALAANNAASSLAEARKLAEQQRYEEAVVEYQRYLGASDRPAKERASALFELGFIHLVLGDEANADARALEALELDSRLPVPAGAPPKQVEFLQRTKRQFMARARLEVLDRQPDDPPQLVRVAVADPDGKVRRVLLRHSLAQTGPFSSSEMQCNDGQCAGAIPPPSEGTSFNAFYFVEALDDAKASVAKTGGPSAPLQLSVVAQKAWYRSPWVWGISGAALIAIGAVVYLVSPTPPK